VTDSFIKAFVNILGTKLKSIASRKANPAMKAATRLASTVTMATDSNLKVCVNDEVIKLSGIIIRSIDSGVKAVMGDSSTKLASATTGKMHSVMKSLADEVGAMLTFVVTSKVAVAVKAAKRQNSNNGWW
jgi:hypothetical protein